MNDERIDEYLNDIDAAMTAPLMPPVAFAHWLQLRCKGVIRGTHDAFMRDAQRGNVAASWDALTAFGAVDDDDYVDCGG